MTEILQDHEGASSCPIPSALSTRKLSITNRLSEKLLYQSQLHPSTSTGEKSEAKLHSTNLLRYALSSRWKHNLPDIRVWRPPRVIVIPTLGSPFPSCTESSIRTSLAPRKLPLH